MNKHYTAQLRELILLVMPTCFQPSQFVHVHKSTSITTEQSFTAFSCYSAAEIVTAYGQQINYSWQRCVCAGKKVMDFYLSNRELLFRPPETLP